MKAPLTTRPFSNSFANLPDTFYSRIKPSPFNSKSYLIHFNTQTAALLDLAPEEQHSQHFINIFSGKQLPDNANPIAMLYSGHQFGHYVEQLGDGRAIMIGEITNQTGAKWELQLKGSGTTAYSRQGDGRAVLRSSIREYLCSEAIHGLGIPTTRALCLIGNNDEIYREKIETAAIVTRLAPSHIRFGSFEVFFYRNQHKQIKVLADFVIQHHYPELKNKPNPYIELLNAVIDKTARLIAQWQSVGFAHGVMNTDNMSILGLTLDYGPFGFLDAYNPKFICNHSDYDGRYAFDQQPQIGLFNLSCLAQALLPLMDVESAQAALATYQDTYTHDYNALMANKLGFINSDPTVVKLQESLLKQMQQSQVDYTLFFRTLSHNLSPIEQPQKNTLRNMFSNLNLFDHWLADYIKHFNSLSLSLTKQQQQMQKINPKYILRNYMAQIAIQKAEHEQDYSEIDKLITLIQSPFDEHPQMEHYAGLPPDWANTLSVSCSS